SQAKETKKMIIEFILSGQCCIFRNKNGELYFFGPNAYYEELNESKAVTLIMDICRKLLNINTNEYDYSYFKGIYKLLSVTPEIHIPENYNTENLLAFKNSILNVKTNEVYENNGNIFITYNIIANFAPNLSDEFPTPNFDKFIDRYTGGDDLLKERLLQMLGYTISPDNDGQLFTILYGPPMTGKTTLLDFVRMLFSKEAISELSLEQCKEKFKLGELDGKAVNMCGDLSSDPIDNNTVAIIKKLTGNDGLTAEHKGKDPFRFKNKAKFIACTNHKITINVDDPGLARRMVFIPLLYPVEYKFSAEAVINTLLPEIDAIVIKLLNAYNRLRANNYVPQPISIGYGAETFLEVKSKDIIRNMHIADFFGSCCVFDPNEKIYIDTLYMAYMKFCQDNLFEYHKTQQSFTTELKNYLSGAVKNQQIEFSKFRLNNQPPKSGIKGIALKV
ncbi:MAG: hypothetical protein IJ583_12440, partial [Firmicutes bacterium]|nr:hypothetical protein [Bacillota bacterium]